MTKVLHLTMNPITTEGGYSQRILRQIGLFKGIDNLEIYVLNFNSVKYISKSNLQKFSKLKSKLVNRNIKEIRLKLKLPGPLYKLKEELIDYYYVNVIKKYIEKHKIDLIYAENLFAAYYASIIKKKYKIDYVMDYHGVSPEEMVEFSNDNSISRYKYLKRIEKEALQNAKNVICVSNVFKDYLIKEFKLIKSSIHVIPSCIPLDYIDFNNDTRYSLRKDLQFENKKVIVYAGGTGLWHCFREMVEVFKKFHQFDESFYFLVLVNNSNSKNIPQLSEIFLEYGLNQESFIIRSVEHDSIKKYYMASDYGIIVRNNSLVNKVASPTKIPEYLSSGLCLISTDNIGDVRDIPGNKILFKYEDISTIKESIIKKSNFDRTENYKVCKEYLIKNYTWDMMSEKYKEVFLK